MYSRFHYHHCKIRTVNWGHHNLFQAPKAAYVQANFKPPMPDNFNLSTAPAHHQSAKVLIYRTLVAESAYPDQQQMTVQLPREYTLFVKNPAKRRVVFFCLGKIERTRMSLYLAATTEIHSVTTLSREAIHHIYSHTKPREYEALSSYTSDAELSHLELNPTF